MHAYTHCPSHTTQVEVFPNTARGLQEDLECGIDAMIKHKGNTPNTHIHTHKHTHMVVVTPRKKIRINSEYSTRALQEDHLEQIKLARSKASNLLVPEDYDGSTYHAKLSRELAEV